MLSVRTMRRCSGSAMFSSLSTVAPESPLEIASARLPAISSSPP